jgi:urease accessory protein
MSRRINGFQQRSAARQGGKVSAACERQTFGSCRMSNIAPKSHGPLRKAWLGAAGFAAAPLAAGPAFAHHPLGGMPMETFAHGLLSGVGHPILGFDHLFFVALVGIAALYTSRQFTAPLAYIGAMTAGCLFMVSGVAMPMAEIVIGLSLLALGAVVLSGRAMSAPVAMAAFAAAGLFHGSAFGTSIAGQEAAAPAIVVLGYLIGLAAIQYAISIAAGIAVKTVWNATEATAVQARLAGAVVAGVGAFMTLENAEGLAFAALGIAA